MSTTDLVFDIFAIDRASAVFSRVGKEAEGAGSAADRGSKMLNTALMGAAGVTAYFGVKAVEMAGNFQASMTRLTTTAGELPSNMSMVTAGIEQMAGKVGYSVSDLAQAMYYVESGGIHGAAGLKTLQAAAEGARIEGSNVTDVAHALTGALNDYHGTTLTATEATNAMTAAVGHGMMTFQDLAEAMPNIGARAAAAHVTFSEMLAALGTMTKDGLPAAKAATYLGQSIGHLAAPSAIARKEMESLGINATAVAATITSGSGHGLGDAINMLYDGIQNHLVGAGLLSSQALHQMANSTSGYQKVLANLPPTVQTSIQALAEMTGGVRSFQGVLMLGGAHADQYRQTLDAVNKSVKAGGDQITGWNKVQDNFNQKLADAKGAVSALGVEIGTDLLPVAGGFVTVLGDLASFLAQNKTLVEEVGTGAVIAASALGVFKVATMGVALAEGIAAGASEGFGLSEAFLNVQLAATAFATEGAASGFAFLGAAMDATPFGLIALGIGGVAAAVLGLTGAFGSGSSDAAQFKRAMQQVDQSTGPSASHIQSLSGTFDHLKGSITGATLAMVEQNLEQSGVLTQAAKFGISELTLSEASLGRAGSLRLVNQALSEQSSRLADLKAQSAADQGLMNTLTAGASSDAALARAMGSSKYRNAANDLQSVNSQITSLESAIKLVSGAFSNETATVSKARTEWKNTALAASATEGAFKGIKNVAEFMNQPLTHSAQEVAQLAIAFHLSSSQIKTVMTDEMVKGTVSGVQSMVAAFEKIGHYHFDLSNVTGSWTQQVGQWANVGTTQFDAMGVNMMTTLATAIATHDNKAITAVQEAVTKAIAAGKNAAGIKSPSTVFREMGGYMIQGLVLGITDNSTKASKAAEEAVKKAVAAAHKATMTSLHIENLQLGYALSDTKTMLSGVTKEITTAQQWASSFHDNVFTAALTMPAQWQTMNIGGVNVRTQTGGGALPTNATPAQTLAAMMAYEKNSAAQNASLAKDIATLRHKGLSQIALDDIKGSGKDSMQEIAALAGATKAQIAQFNAYESHATNSLYNAGAYATAGTSYAHLKKQQANDERQVANIKKALQGLKLTIANGGKTLRVTG